MDRLKQVDVAKECNWSRSYINDILLGKKGCNKETMKIIKKYYPNLKWKKIIKIRYKVDKGDVLNVNN